MAEDAKKVPTQKAPAPKVPTLIPQVVPTLIPTPDFGEDKGDQIYMGAPLKENVHFKRMAKMNGQKALKVIENSFPALNYSQRRGILDVFAIKFPKTEIPEIYKVNLKPNKPRGL